MEIKMNLFILALINICFLLSIDSRKLAKEENSNIVKENAGRLFKVMKTLNDKYKTVLDTLEQLDKSDINKKIYKTFLSYGGIVDNQLNVPKMRNEVKVVPSYLHLGDYHMIDLASTTVFYHDLRSTANTIFELVELQSNFRNFYQNISMNLNKLELIGLGELVEKSGTTDYVQFAYKDVPVVTSIKLANVKFEAELHLRVSGNTLKVENVRSFLTPDLITVTLKFNNTEQSVDLEPTHGASIIRSLNDLCGRWLVEYMNRILDEHIDLPKIMSNQLDELRTYFYERTQILNSFLDPTMENVEGVMKPFIISTPYGVSVNFTKGTYHDLSSLYRDKPTTAIFYLDANGEGYDTALLSGRFRFSRLKLFLNYNAILPQMSVPLEGVVIVEEDQAYMNLDLKVSQDKVEWFFKNSYPADSFSLTVQGPLSRYFSTVKHVLTHQVLALAKMNMQDVFKGVAVKL